MKTLLGLRDLEVAPYTNIGCPAIKTGVSPWDFSLWW